MPKFEEILKAQGFTDDEIAAQSSLDPKIKAAVEANFTATQQTLTKFQEENAAWAKYNEENVLPEVARLEKERNDLRLERASLSERLKLAEEGGFAPKREEPVVTKQPEQQQPAFDDKQYVKQGDIARFADLEGAAIAMSGDLIEEYRYLTGGKSLIDYTANIDGRTVRGLTALRQEALAAKQPIADYVAKKFDFDAKRNAIAETQRKAAEDVIRADERSKVMGQYGDPNQRPLMPSMNPFTPRSREAGKMPWEIPAQERKRDRIEHAMKVQSGAVN